MLSTIPAENAKPKMSTKAALTFGLPAEVLSALRQVFKENSRIEQVILYGSRAKGNFRIGSDIDLCIQGKLMNLNDLYKIEEQIDDLLLPWKVDLTLIHHIDNPDLLEHIQRVGIPCYP